MVDVSKIKVGDEITVRYVVEAVAPQDRFSVRVKSRDVVRKDWFSASEITTHSPAPRAFASGDKVTWGGGAKGEIIAIYGDQAWINAGDHRHTVNIANLRHADAPAEGEAKRFSFGDHVEITRLSTVVYRFLAYVRDGRCAVWNDESQSCCWFAASDLSHADEPADEIVVTDEEAKRAFDFFYDSESGVCEGAMQKTLVEFMKRRKEAGR